MWFILEELAITNLFPVHEKRQKCAAAEEGGFEK